MSLRKHLQSAAVIAIVAVALLLHLGVGATVVAAASRWAGWAAAGLVAVVVIVLHLAGLHRLAARRGKAADRSRDGE